MRARVAEVVGEAIDVTVLDGGLLVLEVCVLGNVPLDFPPPHAASVSVIKLTATTACPNRLT